MKPIVMDIESSGLDKVKCGIWQIGAIDLNDNEEFLEESRIDDEDFVEEDALKVIGKTEEELRDKNKQSQEKLIMNFFDWIKKRVVKNFLCQNPQFDVAFIEIKAKKYGLEIPFKYKCFDLHTIAQMTQHKINGRFLFEEGRSKMNLKEILEFVGMKDNRQAHNALEDCKLTAECFSRLMYGKNLFKEYSEFKIPGVFEK
jgi:DNA polymerase III epsilon subunit-like protein